MMEAVGLWVLGEASVVLVSVVLTMLDDVAKRPRAITMKVPM
jgi:hypothetical protein